MRTNLETVNELTQRILSMRWPMGVKSIDDRHDEELKRLKSRLDKGFTPIYPTCDKLLPMPFYVSVRQDRCKRL